MNTKAIVVALLLASVSSSAMAGGMWVPKDIPQPKPDINIDPSVVGNLFDDDSSDDSSGGGGIVITPEIVDALDGAFNPDIIILDDGVGSSGPVKSSGDGKGGGDKLVIRLACKLGPEGLVLTNVGETDAPAGIKLRWKVAGAGKGMVRLDRTLAAGHAAALPGIDGAPGAACGVALVS